MNLNSLSSVSSLCKRLAISKACILAGVGLPFAAITGNAFYFNGFEVDADGWSGSTVTRVETGGGTLGHESASGGYHGEITGASYHSLGGTRSEYPNGGFSQSIDVYIDMSWNTLGGSESLFKVDMIPAYSEFVDPSLGTAGNANYAANWEFNVKQGDGEIVIDLSGLGGNTNRITEINQSGWYTFQAVFERGATDDAPALTTLQVYDQGGVFLGEHTIEAIPGNDAHDPSSIALGGTGFVWIRDFHEGLSGIAIDNLAAVPEPGTYALIAGLSVLGVVLLRRTRQNRR